MSKIIGGTPFGRGDALIDASEAVLLAGVSVAVVGAGRPDGVETVVALNLTGRVNKTTTVSDVLYLLDSDGAAAIVSELLGVAHRADPRFLDQLLTRINGLPKEAS